MKFDETQAKSGIGKNLETSAAKFFGMSSSTMQFQSHASEKISFSAPGKINMEKEGSEKGRKSATDTLPIHLEDNEAIPAATYQPSPERGDSDSSTDFEGEVNKVMDGKHSVNQ